MIVRLPALDLLRINLIPDYIFMCVTRMKRNVAQVAKFCFLQISSHLLSISVFGIGEAVYFSA
jgi:hypothetical protein